VPLHDAARQIGVAGRDGLDQFGVLGPCPLTTRLRDRQVVPVPPSFDKPNVLGQHGISRDDVDVGVQGRVGRDEPFRVVGGQCVQPVLLPGSVYTLGSTCYPRARDIIAAGLPVVLATDFNPGSSPTPSMPMILSLACTQMKMSPAEAITAATINAAYSLSRAEKIGSLEPGKLANFAVFAVEDYRELAYWFGNMRPDSVYVRGVCVCDGGL